MPGNGQPGCNVHWSVSDILSTWPSLEYLPRPETPREYSKAYAQWKKEYSQWKGLKCSRQKGAYFCRRHGKWITCTELLSGEARPQHEDKEGNRKYRCPPSHYEWEEWEKEFVQQHSAHVKALEKQMAETEEAYQTVEVADPSQRLESGLDQLHIGSSPRGEEAAYAYQQQDYYAGQSPYVESSTVEVAGPGQRLEPELDQHHIGSSPRGEEAAYAYQQQDYYAGQSAYVGSSTVEVADPGQRLESELDQHHIGSSPRGEEGAYAYQQQDYYAGQSSYGEPSSFAGTAHRSDKISQKRESKSSSSRSGPQYSTKGHRSKGSKSHSSKDSRSSKSTRATYSTTASSPPSESYLTQPIPATASDNRGEDLGPNDYSEPDTNSYQEDEDQDNIVLVWESLHWLEREIQISPRACVLQIVAEHCHLS
ncbi:hypothetical protein QBC37DRAFT_400826 [Rhypophila decipiens]|uniref:Uncharacterized protein n=1 Tax=Rhypophila decipiens TaxID=261697 RepID=A0AAN6Y5V0_9PEZI|nr:hypothetical protein QBC37DRAFT_400826 [Rhypophila decipiens]